MHLEERGICESLNNRCLIHNAHLGKISSFCKILDLKITHLKKNFDWYFCLISATVIQAWHSKAKTIILLKKMVCILTEKIRKSYVRNASELCEWGTRSCIKNKMSRYCKLKILMLIFLNEWNNLKYRR
jgi:hypothetical protein